MPEIDYQNYVEDTRKAMQAERDAELQEKFEAENDTVEEPSSKLQRAIHHGAPHHPLGRLRGNVTVGALKAAFRTVEAADDVIGAVGGAAGAAGNPTGNAAVMFGTALRKKLKGEDGTETETTEIEPISVPPLQTTFPEFFEAANNLIDEVDQTNSTSDGIVQGITQFTVPFSAYLRMLGGVSKTQKLASVGKVVLAEGVTAASAFDEHEGRMADLLVAGQQMENWFGAIMNFVAPDGSLVNDYINWMTDRENEGQWEGRWKNAVDSWASTAAVAGVLKTAGLAFRGARQVFSTKTDFTPPARNTKHSVGETGEHSVNIANTGEAIAQEGDGILQIKNIQVAEDQRGTGAGMALLLRMADEAESRGLRLVSDVTVSQSAARLYDALERRGYEILRNASTTNPNTGNLISKDPRVPVFEVTGYPAKDK